MLATVAASAAYAGSQGGSLLEDAHAAVHSSSALPEDAKAERRRMLIARQMLPAEPGDFANDDPPTREELRHFRATGLRADGRISSFWSALSFNPLMIGCPSRPKSP